MTKFIESGDTIEGDSVSIQVRQWIPSSIVEVPAVKKRMFRYSSKRNSSAEVKKTHVVDDNPEVIVATNQYHRTVGDSLECFGMKVYIDCFRKLRTTVQEGITGRHGAILGTTANHTIAEISIPLACLQKAIAEKKSEKERVVLLENSQSDK